MALEHTDSSRSPAIRNPPSDGTPAVRCGGCSRAYDLHDWLALPLAGVLTGEAIAAHVLKWPRGVRIEIRACARCGKAIARRNAADDPGPEGRRPDSKRPERREPDSTKPGSTR
jgi:hypothetical protein